MNIIQDIKEKDAPMELGSVISILKKKQLNKSVKKEIQRIFTNNFKNFKA